MAKLETQRLHLELTGLDVAGRITPSSGGVAALASHLAVLVRLQRLTISRNAFSSRDVSEFLAPALAHMTQLQRLEVSNARLGPALATLACVLPDSLERLDLAGNDITSACERSGFLTALAKLIRLRHISLARNALGSGAVEIVKVLTKLHALQTLDLRQVHLGDSDAANLAPLLQQIGLETLLLGSNSLTVDGACAITARLSKSALLHLDLSAAGLHDITPLVPLLCDLHALQSVNLRQNGISEGACWA